MTEESKTNVEDLKSIAPVLEEEEKESKPAPEEPAKKKRRLSEKQIQALEKGRERRWNKAGSKKVIPDTKERKTLKIKEPEPESSSAESEAPSGPLSDSSFSGSEPTSASEQSDAATDYTSPDSDDFVTDSDQSDSVDSTNSLDSPPPPPAKLKRTKRHDKKRPAKNIQERVDAYLAQYRFV